MKLVILCFACSVVILAVICNSLFSILSSKDVVEVSQTKKLVLSNNETNSTRNGTDTNETNHTQNEINITAKNESMSSTNSREIPLECKPFVRKSFQLIDVGRFIRSYKTPSYDYLCGFMKPRYNCAGSPVKPSAFEWKLVLKSVSSNSSCDISTLVDSYEGPSGIANYLLSRSNIIKNSKSINKNESTRNQQKKIVKVLFIGNSYIRQIFEALACRWYNEITDTCFQNSGAVPSLAFLRSRGIDPFGNKTGEGTRYIDINEIGNFTHINLQKEQCHDFRQIFYRDNVTLPANISSIPSCNDNIAYIEFGASIRFYNLIRPDIYKPNAINYFMNQLSLKPESIDYIFFNNDHDKHLPKSFASKIRKLVWNARRDLSVLLQKLAIIQKKYTGKFYGADNPWITNPPDGHGCMPGVPDDEANLVLFSLLAQNRIMIQ